MLIDVRPVMGNLFLVPCPAQKASELTRRHISHDARQNLSEVRDFMEDPAEADTERQRDVVS